MDFAGAWDRITERPFTALVAVVALAILVGGVLALVSLVVTSSQTSFAGQPQEDVRTGVPSDGGEDAGSGAFVEVQEASYTVDSMDAEQDAATVADLAGDHDGYVESRTRYEDDLALRVRMTVRVPSDDFAAFNDAFRSELDVSSYEVRNERVSIQRELDEIAVLNRTLQDYEGIRQRILAEDVTTENLELLASLTERELWVTQQLRRYQRELASDRSRADYATVQVELVEQKSVDITPDNIGNRFRNAVKQMVDALVTISIDTVTGALVVLFRVLQAIVYLVIILVPFALAYRYGRRIHERYWKQD